MRYRRMLVVLFCWLVLAAPVPAAAGEGPGAPPPAPGKKETCPVCGMFVALYPDWIATVGYRDGVHHHFDGAKDMFKYLAEMNKWAPGRHQEDISGSWVTEYYGLKLIEAPGAWFVIGSDVLGPMGHELIPLASSEDAEEFVREHKGKRILRFDEVRPRLLENLDQGRFEH